jgi:hypothetical protein
MSEPAEHKVEETIFYDDPLPHRHPLTSYVCHAHFVWLMGPAAGEHAQRRRSTAVERIEHIARDVAHELHARDCFAFTGNETKPHSPSCEAAYERIKATLTSYARGLNEP